MLVYLHVEKGPHLGRRIDLKHGQTAVFGSSDFSDFCFSEDQQMAEKHFQLSIKNNRCCLVHLSKDHISEVNAEEITTTDLIDGDILRAGQTCFRIHIENRSAADDTAANIKEIETVQEIIDLKERCICIELSEDAVELSNESQTREELVEVLKSESLFEDAIRLQADILETATAIKWANQAIANLVGEELTETDRTAVDAVNRWIEEPTEENRRLNEALAEKLDYAGIGGAITAAVFLSGGSIGASDLGHDIDPEPYSAGQALTVALLLAALDEDPDETETQFKLILDMATE
ncbi:hypothetical protein N9006_02025 [bacterium]|nr:hypothetical protein [bacterium]